MSEDAGAAAPPEQDETVRVREQTANDIGSTDAFGAEDDEALDQDG
jgi:hypothetical protein